MITKQTSREAKQNFTQKQKHYKAIFSVLKNNNGVGLDNLQVSQRCYLSYIQVARRMGELRDLGKVYEHSKQKLQGYRSAKTVWALNEK